MRILSLSATIAALAFPMFASASSIVANGDFSGPAAAYPGYGPITSWSVVTSPTNTYNPYMSGPGAGTPFDGAGVPSGATNVGFIQVYTPGGDTYNELEQDVTLVNGQDYYLSYLESYRGGYADPTLSILIGGATMTSGIPLSSSSFDSVGDSFVYSGATGTVALDVLVTPNDGAPDSTALITQLSIAATPEPSSLALLGTGLLGAAGMIRRRVRA